MSTKKYAIVEKIFSELITYWNVKDNKGLAAHINVPYQTLMAWKKRGSIADLAPFMDKGISKWWLETGEGPMLAGSGTGVGKEIILKGKKKQADISPQDQENIDLLLKLDNQRTVELRAKLYQLLAEQELDRLKTGREE